jgi:hypothetical protein
MPENAGWDPNWWRSERALSIERKAAAALAEAEAMAGDSFLIVTEGEVTEPTYFDQFRRALHLSAVKVVVRPGDASDARQVIETAARLAQRQIDRATRGVLAINEPTKFDQVWAVLDTDVPERKRIWPDIVALAGQRNVRLAASTPCFEFWLLLHRRYTTAPLRNGDAAKAAVHAEIGDYSTNQEIARNAIAQILPSWPDAVVHAGRVRRYHRDAASDPPANPSTEVDRLATALNYSAPEFARKLKPA